MLIILANSKYDLLTKAILEFSKTLELDWCALPLHRVHSICGETQRVFSPHHDRDEIEHCLEHGVQVYLLPIAGLAHFAISCDDSRNLSRAYLTNLLHDLQHYHLVCNLSREVLLSRLSSVVNFNAFDYVHKRHFDRIARFISDDGWDKDSLETGLCPIIKKLYVELADF